MTKRIKLTYGSFLQSKVKLKDIGGERYFSSTGAWLVVPKFGCDYDLFVINKYGIFNKE